MSTNTLTVDRLREMQKRLEPKYYFIANACDLLGHWREFKKNGFELRRVQHRYWFKVYHDGVYFADLYIDSGNHYKPKSLIMVNKEKFQEWAFPRLRFTFGDQP